MTPPDEVLASRKYRPIAEIGRGGMAEVYLAVAEGPAGFKKLIVLKLAKRALSDQPEFLDMFLDEARLAARLNHPNVVQTYEVGQEGGRYFIAMEYLDGQPFHRVRTRIGTRWFPLGMQIRVFIDMLAGLHHAHELADFDGTPLGVVHRDATPQNVFVTYDGQVKIVDFGIAKVIGASSQTKVGILKGKVAYMAPEQARGDRVDRRVDIFAVGVMLWEAIAGERMWPGVDDLAIIGRLVQGRIPSLPADAPNADPDLVRICLRALSSARDARHATAVELAHELERWLERRGEEATSRAVGRFVAAHFTEERAHIKALIERELRTHGRERGVGAGDETKIEAVEALRESSRVTRIERQPEAPPPRPVLQSPRPVLQESEIIPETLRHSSVSVDAVRERSTASRIGRSGRVSLTIGSAVLLASALGVVVWVVEGTARPPVETAIAASPSAPATPLENENESASLRGAATAAATATATAAVGEVELTVRVWPNTAKLLLDGLPLSTGWYKGKLPKDGRVHRIRAEAPYFTSKEQLITANGEVIVNLALDIKSPAGKTR